MDKSDRLELMRSGLGCRRDLRQDIRDYILTPGLCTQKELAGLLGLNPCNFSAYLAGRIPLPYDRVEMVLWLLQGN